MMTPASGPALPSFQKALTHLASADRSLAAFRSEDARAGTVAPRAAVELRDASHAMMRGRDALIAGPHHASPLVRQLGEEILDVALRAGTVAGLAGSPAETRVDLTARESIASAVTNANAAVALLSTLAL